MAADSISDSIDGINNIKAFAKSMLKAQIFIGTFQEKRYVEALDSYKDVVKIDDNEKEFIRILKEVREKIRNNITFRKSNPFEPKWIGITTPNIIGAPVGFCLLVNLTTNIFGKYWFKVKRVVFTDDEVRLELDIIRPFGTESSTVIIEKTGDFDIRKSTNNLIQSVNRNIIIFSNNCLTSENIMQAFSYILILVATICTGAFNLVHYLMEYFLKLLREVSLLVKVSTPIFIALISLLGKSINGLYGLIFLLIRGRPKPPPVYTTYYNVNPSQPTENYPNFRPVLTYAKIRPIEN